MAVDKKIFYVKISSPVVAISHSKKVQCIIVDSSYSFRSIQDKILDKIDIDKKSHVIKARNSKGSVITLTGKVPSNTSDNPYHIEVIPHYYHAKPLSFVNRDYLTVFVNAKLKSFTRRLEALQAAIPDYPKTIEERIFKARLATKFETYSRFP
ncbi:Hypothetical predicted protein [Octopus vulgaris]|uniref:Uncharacterized protein n=1 Tax=Octopus vulgaris TaxID=6645 RepID=A0AA36AQ41_OCTVU|nr:Hypothetical predicted protein [Octopus vulgaris]